MTTPREEQRIFRTIATHNLTLAEFVEQMDGDPDDLSYDELIDRWIEAKMKVAQCLMARLRYEGMV